MKHEVALSAFLAVYHHQNNMAMLFLNPNTKVRLLLSYVLFEVREQTARIILGMRYRAIISECHLRLKEITEQHRVGKLSDDEAIRMGFLFTDKASLAHQQLVEIRNASG